MKKNPPNVWVRPQVLKQVKDQTGVRILYDAGKMKRVPCREMKIADLEVTEALKQILKDTRFEFFEEGGVFIVREALSQQVKAIRIVGKVTDEKERRQTGRGCINCLFPMHRRGFL